MPFLNAVAGVFTLPPQTTFAYGSLSVPPLPHRPPLPYPTHNTQLGDHLLRHTARKAATSPFYFHVARAPGRRLTKVGLVRYCCYDTASPESSYALAKPNIPLHALHSWRQPLPHTTLHACPCHTDVSPTLHVDCWRKPGRCLLAAAATRTRDVRSAATCACAGRLLPSALRTTLHYSPAVPLSFGFINTYHTLRHCPPHTL